MYLMIRLLESICPIIPFPCIYDFALKPASFELRQKIQEINDQFQLKVFTFFLMLLMWNCSQSVAGQTGNTLQVLKVISTNSNTKALTLSVGFSSKICLYSTILDYSFLFIYFFNDVDNDVCFNLQHFFQPSSMNLHFNHTVSWTWSVFQCRSRKYVATN